MKRKISKTISLSMQQGISNTEFYGDVVYKLKKII